MAETDIKKDFRDSVDKLEEYAEFRGIKVWERMKEFGYDKKLEDLGFKVYVQTKYYPYYFKDYPEYRLILSPTQGYMLTNYTSEYARFNSIYYLVKGGSSKVSDLEKLYKNYNLEEFKLMFDVLNLRKKLEPYVSNNSDTNRIKKDVTVSRYNISLSLLEDVIANILIDLKDEEKSIRLKKVMKRFKDNNLDRYFIDSGYEEIYLSSKNKKLPVPIYIKRFNDFTLIIAYQQIYLLEEDGRLITIGNISSYDSTLKDIIEFGEKHNIQDVVLFSKFNNLRLKLSSYISSK